MVQITEELVRKKSEHNEGEICTLEELSLHQENVEKIDHLQNWCKELQILLLQGNIISKIENLHKLKKLQYLNLALNNIELIENLERCESLEKLDLTLNFIGKIESVCSLKNNIHLKDLYLTGNPCTDYKNYRFYVIAKLPQITNLDNTEIKRSERLQALQLISSIEENIFDDQEKYLIKRNAQKVRLKENNTENIPDEEFWKQQSEHCPEVRVEMAERQRRARNTDKTVKQKSPVRLFNKNGRPMNINQAKIKFKIDLENDNEIILDLVIYKYLDTNLIKVDVQPTYVTVYIKEKVFQIVLPEEILTDKTICQRSQITGHLVIKMPKLKPKIPTVEKTEKTCYKNPTDFEKKQRREYLEIGPDRLTQICNISEYTNKENIIDDGTVPPLE